MNTHADPALQTLALAEQVLAPTYTRPERLFVAGQGAHLEDAQGRRYLDMTSGVAVNALGHGSPRIQAALSAGLKGLLHTSNLYHTAPAIELARCLVERSFADKVFFANSGAESVEGAIKFARLHGGPERRQILAFEGSFHGRTLGALAATDREPYQAPFRPLPEGFGFLPWGQLSALEQIGPQTAAVLVEPIQGEGGIRMAEASWLRALRSRCHQVGALLIVDEVQTGLGRTGALWAHQHYDITPDMMTLAKPLAGGLPMGAVLMRDEVAASITPGCHATTFGGGPLVASVALAVVQEIARPDFLKQVRQRGAWLLRALQQLDSPWIDEVRGVGLFVGVVVNRPTAEITQAAWDQGLLLVPAAGGVLRFLPPLNVETRDLEDAVERFDRALKGLKPREEE